MLEDLLPDLGRDLGETLPLTNPSIEPVGRTDSEHAFCWLLGRMVEVGAPAQVFLDAYPGRPYTGKVSRIWPTANRQKATVEVRISFERLDERLRPEMGVRVVFAEAKQGAPAEAEGPAPLLVPSDALVKVDGREGVFVLERGVAIFVALGMALAFDYSAQEGLCPADDATRVKTHLKAAGLPAQIGDLKTSITADAIAKHMMQDKKVEQGKLTLMQAHTSAARLRGRG